MGIEEWHDPRGKQGELDIQVPKDNFTCHSNPPVVWLKCGCVKAWMGQAYAVLPCKDHYEAVMTAIGG